MTVAVVLSGRIPIMVGHGAGSEVMQAQAAQHLGMRAQSGWRCSSPMSFADAVPAKATVAQKTADRDIKFVAPARNDAHPIGP